MMFLNSDIEVAENFSRIGLIDANVVISASATVSTVHAGDV